MPPKKRTAEGGDTNASRSKSRKSGGDTAAGKENEPASDNASKDKDAEANEEEQKRDPYEYVTICRPRSDIAAENRAKPDDERLDEDELEELNECGREGCMCKKPVSEHPEWPWIVMYGGFRKIIDNTMIEHYRNPENFGMYTFNDHHAYGCQEMIENMLVEFNDAKDLKDKWIAIEGLAHFLTSDDSDIWTNVEDGDRANETHNFYGAAILSMLDVLQRADMLKPDSEIKDLGLVVALFLQLADENSSYGIEVDESKWDQYLIAYVKKYNINVAVIPKGEKLLEGQHPDDEHDNEIDLEDIEHNTLGRGGEDAWQWKKKYKTFEKKYAGLGYMRRTNGLGGTDYDITTWTRAQRAKYAFDKKDPLPEKFVKMRERGEKVDLVPA